MARINFKRIAKVAAGAVLLLIVAAFLVFASMDFRWSDGKYLRKLEKGGVEARVSYHGDGGIRSIDAGDTALLSMVFLHGTPGSGRDYSKYLSDTALLKAAHLVALDRPGYGCSDYGIAVTSVVEQAERLAPAVPDSSVIVGHSYGGPVAAALAMYHPRKVKALILLAPAVDPDAEKRFVFNDVLRFPPIHRMLSGAIRVALEEKRTHEAALVEIMGDWGRISQPVTVVHGESDGIVPFENAGFLEEVLVHTNMELLHPADMGHIMIWTDYEWVRDLLLRKIAAYTSSDAGVPEN